MWIHKSNKVSDAVLDKWCRSHRCSLSSRMEKDNEITTALFFLIVPLLCSPWWRRKVHLTIFVCWHQSLKTVLGFFLWESFGSFWRMAPAKVIVNVRIQDHFKFFTCFFSVRGLTTTSETEPIQLGVWCFLSPAFCRFTGKSPPCAMLGSASPQPSFDWMKVGSSLENYGANCQIIDEESSSALRSQDP